MADKRPATGTIDPATARFARMQLERRMVTVRDEDEHGKPIGDPRAEERLYLLTWTADSAGEEHYYRAELLSDDAEAVERPVLRVPAALLTALEELGGLGIARMLTGQDFVAAQAEVLP